MKIVYNTKFVREYNKLPKEVKEKVDITLQLLQENIFDQKLKTHKLKGSMMNFYSCSINYSYRIIFELEKDKIKLLSTGNHNIYE